MNNQIGEQIKELRKKLNLTQSEFCLKIGLKRNSISLVENGKRNISNQTILSICREFHVNEKWLRTGEGEMFAPNAEDDLEAYLSSKGVSKIIQAFITIYLSLTNDMKKVVDEYIEKVYEKIQTETEEVKMIRPEGLSDSEWSMVLKMRSIEVKEPEIDLTRPDGLSDSEWDMIVKKRTAEVGQKKTAS